MPTKNLKLMTPEVPADDEDVVEISARLEVNILIFKIASADSRSNTKSIPQIRSSFTALLLT
jgi:hypothetical protein